MYSQRNHSESLLTQPFHPPADDQLVDQGFIQDQLQQQPPYSQEQLDDINFGTSQLMLSSNAFALQSLDGSMPQSALPAEWPLYSDALTGMADASVYDSDLIADNPMIGDPAWQLISSQQTSQLADSPAQSLSNNANMIINDQLPRAQTPGRAHPRMNAPHYLHMRRRSLSADNIHALAKYQAQRKTVFGNQQQSACQFDRSQFARTQTVTEVIETEDQLQPHGIKLEPQATFQHASGNMIIDPQITSNGNCHDNEQEQSSSDPSTPDSEQIKHAQKQSEFTARFKIKLDKKPQKMPNIHVATANPNILSTTQSRITMLPGVINALSSGMELGSSISTPSTPTFSSDNGSHVDNKPSVPPRRGHTRKRSLSAPQAFNPQGIPGAMPLQTVQPFPFNVSPTPRRLNALPIQISRSHKHSYNSAPMSSEEYQRKLDEELEKVDFEDITVSELKDMLRQRGKPATGKKAVLMQRLQEEMDHLKAKQNQQQNKQSLQNQQNQQQQAVKPKPQQLGNTGNISLANGQFGQMISSPTSPSGISLQHSLGNLHISSPPAHARRYSPYTSVSIPNSPRMHPNRSSAGFNGGNFPFGAGEDWQFNGAIPSPGFVGQASTPMDEQAVYMLMMDNQQTSPQQDYFGPQEPSSAPATTTEFDAYQTPSSAPATTTEFEGFQQSAQPAQTVVNPMYVNMDVPMGMMGVNYNGGMTQDADQTPGSTNAMNGVLASQTGLGFAFDQQQAISDESWPWQ